MGTDLTGKVVAITGASSGIGEATALARAQAGAAGALAARHSDRIDRLAAQITGDGGGALAVEADVGDEQQASAFVARANDQLTKFGVGASPNVSINEVLVRPSGQVA